MWEKTSVSPISGQAGQQPVSTAVPGQSASVSQLTGKTVTVVTQEDSSPQAGPSLPARSPAEPEFSAKTMELRTILKQQPAGESQKKDEDMAKALVQFDQDRALYSRLHNTPMEELPPPPQPADYLCPAVIKEILGRFGFIERLGDSGLDTFVRFVLSENPSSVGEEAKTDTMDRAQGTPEKSKSLSVRQNLHRIRNEVRDTARLEAQQKHEQQVLEVCEEMRSRVQEHEPMPTATTKEKEPSVAAILAEDSSRLYPLLQRKRGYYVVNGLPYTHYSLPQSVRNQLLSDELKDRLSVKARWQTERYFGLASVEDASSFSELMKEARFDEAVTEACPLGVAYSGTGDEQIVRWVEQPRSSEAQCSKKASRLQADLSKPSRQSKQKTLALYNDHTSKRIYITLGKRKETVLKPKSGMLLQPRPGKGQKSMEWTPVAEYRSETRTKETNPLLRDLPGPVEAPGAAKAAWDREGEYFLLPEMVSDLAGEKSKTQERPAVCSTKADIQQAIKTHFGRNGEKTGAGSFIFFDRGVNHTVAVRVLSEDNRALVYIHETQDPCGEVATDIRKKVLNAIQPLFKDLTLSCVSPGFASQVDFNSCSVFAYKTIRAFDKYPELDQWLWAQGRQPDRVLHQAGQYDQRVTLSDLSPDGSFVSLPEMPAQLLKSYQGNDILLSPAQLATTVSHKKEQTLGQYLMAHQPHDALANSQKANLSATGKRYKYLLRWQERFLDKDMPPDSQLVQQMQATADSLTPEEYRLVSRFYPVLDVCDRETANVWLKKHEPDAAQVEESDWSNSCVFETLVFNSDEISLEEARNLSEWLERVLNDSENPHHQLMQAWCIYIKHSKKSWFRNTSLGGIQDALKTLITERSRPVPKKTGTKRKRDKDPETPKPVKCARQGATSHYSSDLEKRYALKIQVAKTRL